MNPSFASLLVTGADARTFLQGQLSCDLQRLTPNTGLLACVNSPQGRVQAVLYVRDHDDGVLLTCVAPLAESTAARLRKYVLRSKVKIEVLDDVERSLPYFGLPESSDWLAHLRAGIPHVFPETHESFVAQMLNLDVLGAISFDKGCYTGQEIIARTRYRGAIKRRMLRFAADTAAPVPGHRLLAKGQHLGDLVYAADVAGGCEFLAVVSLAQGDSVIQLADRPEARVQPLPLPYSLDIQ